MAGAICPEGEIDGSERRGLLDRRGQKGRQVLRQLAGGWRPPAAGGARQMQLVPQAGDQRQRGEFIPMPGGGERTEFSEQRLGGLCDPWLARCDRLGEPAIFDGAREIPGGVAPSGGGGE